MSKLERCLYIIELLSRGAPLSLKEINEHWQYSSLYDDEIIPKTFGRYKEYISDVFAIDIEYDKRANKYYIANFDHIKNNLLYKYLLSAFHIQGLSELAMKHREQLVLEEAPSGIEHLHIILEAIDRKVLVEFDYRSFYKQTAALHECIPCFLKTWERRWYLIAEPLNRKNPTVYALERVSNLRLTDQQAVPSPHIDPQSYFEDCYGVSHEGCKPVLITLKAYGAQVDYIRALPIHISQEEIEQGDDWSVFSYWLRPSYNFYQELLWHREKVEVLKPESVRKEMQKIVVSILANYQNSRH